MHVCEFVKFFHLAYFLPIRAELIEGGLPLLTLIRVMDSPRTQLTAAYQTVVKMSRDAIEKILEIRRKTTRTVNYGGFKS